MATQIKNPMFGVWNEHWKNHPAGLPKSQYKPNTNPNQGASSVPAFDWNAWYNSGGATQTNTVNQSSKQTSTNTSNQSNTQTQTNTNTNKQTNTTTPTTTTQPTGTSAGSGMSPNTGLAGRYTPAMLEQAYENPWYVLRDVFSGLRESSPMYQALRDLGGDPLTLFNIIRGSDSTIDGGSGDFVNWLGEMYGQQGQVGGQDFDAQSLLGALFGQNAFGADATNTLGQILGAGDMSTQVRTLYNMARDVSNVAMNPLAARGYQSALAQAGDRYGQTMMQTPAGADGPQNPSAWIAQNMPWLALR